jgi:hypothetical protein
MQQLADVVQRRGLALPAIFTLELCKPMTGCLRELYDVSRALQGIIFGKELLPAVSEVLASSETVEHFILLLEAAQRGQPKSLRGESSTSGSSATAVAQGQL